MRCGNKQTRVETVQIKKNIPQAVKQFGNLYKVMMFFGPNQKLIDSYVDNIKGDLRNQSYEISILTYEEVKKNPASVWEKITVLDLFNHKRLLIIDMDKGAVSEDFLDLLAADNKLALILIRAGDLPPAHKLRKSFEVSESLTSIGCYDIDLGQLRIIAAQELLTWQIKASPELIRNLSENYYDPGLLKKDIEILDLWLGERRELNAEDILMLSPEVSDYKYLDLAYSLVFNKKKEVTNILNEMEYQGVAHISIIRAMMNFFYRLYSYLELVKDYGAEPALLKVSPPVFFKEKPDFLRACTLFTVTEIIELLNGLNNLERLLKQSDVGAGALIENFFLQLNENKDIYSQLREFLV